jgi:hypothetical protein
MHSKSAKLPTAAPFWLADVCQLNKGISTGRDGPSGQWYRMHHLQNHSPCPSSNYQEKRIHYNSSDPKFHREVDIDRLCESPVDPILLNVTWDVTKAWASLEVNEYNKLQKRSLVMVLDHFHSMTQFFCFCFFFLCLGGWRTTLMAASKTAFTFCNKRQHVVTRKDDILDQDQKRCPIQY